MNLTKNSHYSSSKCGAEAEKLAGALLLSQGLNLIQRNFSCPHGEIDLIMDDGGIVVFVEVRSRKKYDYMTPAESIDSKKQKRIINTGLYFLQKNRAHAKKECRFDVIAMNTAYDPPKMEWIKNAFQV